MSLLHPKHLTAVLAAAIAGTLVLAAAQPAAAKGAPASTQAGAITDDDVSSAIAKAREWFINQHQPDGTFGGGGGGRQYLNCTTAQAFLTLAYMGEHPNHAVMSSTLDYLLKLDAMTDFENKQGYGVPMRVMGFAYIHGKLLGDKRAIVRQKMLEDLMVFHAGQSPNGGWRYLLNGNGFDFSNSQWPILAMREANNVGIEFPTDMLVKAQKLYYEGQNDDGGWAYHAGGKGGSYGSMSAAGLASVFIITDVLEPASGCPCKGGKSQNT